MNKTLTRFVYSLFFLLFFIIAPIFTFYALGYRYDFKSGQLEKTGAFYIKSFPRGADIFIDNQKMARRTNTQITNLRSGNYQIKVSRANYVPWEKELPVVSGETTFAEDIVLFLQNRPKTLLGLGGQKYASNPQKNKYAYIDSQFKLMISDLEQSKNLEIYTLDKAYEILSWTADNQKILLKDELSYYIFDINQRNLYPLSLPLAEKVIWENNDRLIYLNQGQLLRHEVSASRNTTTDALLSEYLINDFDLKENFLLVHHRLEQDNPIKLFDKNSLEIIQDISDVSLGNLEILLAKPDQLIFSAGAKLYIKTKNKDLITIPMTIARLHGDFLLMSNGYEIILYNHKEDWQELIDRSSQIISELMWHPNGSYFIYESSGQTYVSELDSRDRRNIIKIIDDPRKKNYLFNRRGDKLFVLSPEENFYLTIQ
ncbi:MAG: PEGA domain-containing protein [Patescibacteria group bacterium]|nr:PEGA domain-containing protein [Patescibacteria group bacterium]